MEVIEGFGRRLQMGAAAETGASDDSHLRRKLLLNLGGFTMVILVVLFTLAAFGHSGL